MSKHEVIFDNKYLKVIRLSYGVLINIYKAELGTDIDSYIENKRKDIEKLDDKFYKTKIEIVDKWNKTTYPIDTVLYKYNSCCYYVVEDILPKNEWGWELKTTGNCFSGNTKDFQDCICAINDIINIE